MGKILVEYSSNNSGGGWWLDDKEWIALSKAGWDVQWGGLYFCHSKFSFQDKPEGAPEPHESSDKCSGHRRFESYTDIKEDQGRYMGALAKEASKEFNTIQEAMAEFERVTKQTLSDEGCNCCGSPHSFRWNDVDEPTNWHYASGEDFLDILYENGNLSKRELLDKMENK